MAARTLAFAFGVLLPLLLVRLMSQAQFGVYKQAFLVITTAQSILPLSFGTSAFYYLAREGERKQAVVFHIVAYNMVVGLVACLALLIRPGILASIFGSTELVPEAPLIGIAILLSLVGLFLEVVATAHQEAALSALFIVIAQLSKTLFMVIAALWWTSVRALLCAAILQGILQCGLLLWYLRSRFPGFWGAFEWRLLREQLSYALPLGFSGIVFAAQTDLHNYFVAHTFGPAAFAVYSVGCFQLPVIALLRDSVGAVMIPRLSYLQQQGQPREILLVTTRAMRKLAAVYWPAYVFLLVAGREFITVFFTKAYLASWPVFVVNLTLIPLGMIVNDPVLRAYMEERYFILKVRLLLLPLLVGVMWMGLRHFGMVGAIGTVVLIALIERLTVSWRVAVVLGAKAGDLRLLNDIWKLALLAGIAGLAAAVVRSLTLDLKPILVLAISGLVFAAVYLASVFAAGIATPEERSWLRNQWARLSRTA